MLAGGAAFTLFALGVPLALLIPSNTANHIAGSAYVQDDSGINTCLVRNATVAWSDAG